MFSPFSRAISNLELNDLETLRETSEGWYVEYKREIPSAASIAKSISAFANTYGGWLFYGIEELSKENPVAGAFIGIPLGDVDASLQRIRQAVANHMNPAAHFDVKVIHGEYGNSLQKGCAVICLRIPKSFAAPHVHRSGHIYRRVADGAEPKPENDRFLLEQLFHRADELRKDYAAWVERDPEFSDNEKDAPYLRLMLLVDPWHDEDPWIDAKLSEWREIFSETNGILGAMPFDTIYPTSRGYIARQVSTNHPDDLGITWSINQSLSSDILIPFSFYSGSNYLELRNAERIR